MKLVFASDIHGSALWCQRLLEAFDREGAQKLVLVGDILYHGPRNPLPEGHDPKRVAELLNQRRESILCVRGNCDCEVDQVMLDFPVLADYALIYADGVEMFVTHGHHWNKDSLPPHAAGSVLINGHFHIPEITQLGDMLYVNCGSVALPKGGSAHSYAVFEDGSFELRSLEQQ